MNDAIQLKFVEMRELNCGDIRKGARGIYRMRMKEMTR